ncbi:MAG: hypothetical protein N2320_04385 [Candidatus Bipolaricaulota bacterium]|nr:hypothetical protein [Candidatus Bipolaricaulota bacterium]
MESAEDILKGALLLEKRGKALYEASAAGATHAGVRELFLTLAQEEGRHIEVLSQAFASLARTGTLAPGSLGEAPPVAEEVLGAVRGEVEAASYEAAALYAAMALEERAVAYYTEAERKSSGEAKRLYGWLARWEQSHLDLLTALDQDLKQRVWFDQRFWPF